MNAFATRDMVLISLFAAITAVLGLVPPIPVPLVPVPVTAQTLGVMLAGALLGSWRGGASQLLVVVIVALGAPILSGGRGGLGVVFGPSGGFLMAWPIAAFVTGWLTQRGWRSLNPAKSFLFNVAGGIGVVYLVGVPYLAMMADMDLLSALMGASVFLPGDLIKAGVAAIVAVNVKRAYPLIQPS